MRKKSLHIHRILSYALLWVFFIALTPWSALHHHNPVAYSCTNEPVCKHKVHIGTHESQCLICAAHFEKNYLHTYQFFPGYFTSSILFKNQPLLTSLYTKLITTALRGPPVS